MHFSACHPIVYYLSAKRMTSWLSILKEDVDTVIAHDPAAKSRLEVWLSYPGLHAIWAYRIANKLWRSDSLLLARLISQFARFITGVEIHPGARIARRVFIDHGMGVVIGETASVGEGCILYQGAVLGGTSLAKTIRHPQLGKNVVVGAHACILGAIEIGDSARIGSGSVVVRPVPSGATVVGVPGRVVPKSTDKDAQFEATLDHASLPDPTMEILRFLRTENELLRERIRKLEDKCQIAHHESTENTSLIDAVLATTDLPDHHGG